MVFRKHLFHLSKQDALLALLYDKYADISFTFHLHSPVNNKITIGTNIISL